MKRCTTDVQPRIHLTATFPGPPHVKKKASTFAHLDYN